MMGQESDRLFFKGVSFEMYVVQQSTDMGNLTKSYIFKKEMYWMW